MRVTKAQAQANRERIVETASKLFREYGYDGGVADLMEAAGSTQGKLYNHFRSKADLMAEATASGISQIEAKNGNLAVAELFSPYQPQDHRDARSVGCTLGRPLGRSGTSVGDCKNHICKRDQEPASGAGARGRRMEMIGSECEQR